MPGTGEWGGWKGKGRRSEKYDCGSRTSQQRVELLFNYIFTNPGAHLNCLRLDTCFLFPIFFFLLLSGPPTVKQ